MAEPRWSKTDDDTQTILDLVADVDHPSVDFEWQVFKDAVTEVAKGNHGRVTQNALRPLVRGKVAPKRIAAFYNRACSINLLVATDDWVISDDKAGRNAGRPTRVYTAPEYAKEAAR